MLVDAVGITDEDVVARRRPPGHRADPTVPLKNLLRDIGMGLTDDENLKSAALRLVRLNNKLSDAERDEFAHAAGGSRMTEVIEDLRNAARPGLPARGRARADRQGRPRRGGGRGRARAARRARQSRSCAGAEVREKLEQLQMTVSEQLIHIGGHDQLISAGFIDNPIEAKRSSTTWRAVHRGAPRRVRRAEGVLRAAVPPPAVARRHQGARGRHQPPAAATSRPRRSGRPTRRSTRTASAATAASSTPTWSGSSATPWSRTTSSCPTSEVVQAALRQCGSVSRSRPGESSATTSCAGSRWSRDHIAESMTFDPAEDYDFPPFSLEGGATAAYQLFGRELNDVVDRAQRGAGGGMSRQTKPR